MKTRVFVYGSLLRGLHNHEHYLSRARFLGSAETVALFRLYSLGSYPGMVWAGRKGRTVKGEVYEVTSEELADLDRLESHPTFYRRTLITLNTGEVVETYLLQRGMKDGVEVRSGDWRDYCATFDRLDDYHTEGRETARSYGLPMKLDSLDWSVFDGWSVPEIGSVDE